MKVDVYIDQFSQIVAELPEKQIKRILDYARRVKKETDGIRSSHLSVEEILVLAEQEAVELRSQPRPVIEARYEALLKALEAEVQAKDLGI